MSLPAYQSQEQAYRAGVAVLAPYIDGSTLDSLSRVNTAFFGVFGGYLWSDPIKIISRSRTPYTKAIRFITRKHQERYSDLVRVLDFRPLVMLKENDKFINDFVPNERYFNCQFIFNQLTCFKNLKFVVVDDIQIWNNSYFCDNTCPRYNTKSLLLSVPSSVLLDSSAVLEADYFTNLMYLDISGTYHAAAAIASLSNYEFGNLRVLKMRNMRLTKVPHFILTLGLRLWSLDVSSNLLTDNDIDSLILYCIKPAIRRPNPLPQSVCDAVFFDFPPEYQTHGEVYDDMPARRPDSATLFIEAMINSQDAVSNPIYSLTGVTQLYISNNKITSNGTRLLLSTTNRLQVLDLGATLSNLDPSMYSTPHATVYHAHSTPLIPPSQLERIRVHHSFITSIPTITLGSPTTYHTAYIDAAEKFAINHASSDSNTPYDPLQNHRITHLILTDIPTKSYGILITNLTSLIRKAAKQFQGIEDVRSSSLASGHLEYQGMIPF
ncbi:hypothetical protein IFR05_004189 [Cadophora sp. M221]|nr:hypothetical protein IFR05_004189 [Cadophora sp. M221]